MEAPRSVAFLGLQVLLISAAVSFLATPWVIRLGHRFGALDQPGPRKVHTHPIPRVGGVSIFVGMLVALGFAAFETGFLPANLHERGPHWASLVAAATCIFVMGLVDDVRGLSVRSKFAAQIASGVLVWLFGFRIEQIALPLGFGAVDLGSLSIVVTVLWIVGVTNAFNLVDGLDGLAAGTALISTSAVAAIALYRGQVAVTAASVALVGALVGFLRYNFAPARIFLGDSGSMLLGFLLAVLSIHASQKGSTAVAVLAPVLVLGVPLLDTLLAVVRRLYRLKDGGGSAQRRLAYALHNLKTVFLPDRAHLHHRLLDMGLSQRTAVLTLYLGSLLSAFAALSLIILQNRALSLALLAAAGALTVTLFGWGRSRKPRRPASVGGVWKSALGDSTANAPE